MNIIQQTMKKVALPIIGCLLFVAGYYHVHRHAAIIETKKPQAVVDVTETPTAVLPFKTMPAFVFRSEKYFAF